LGGGGILSTKEKKKMRFRCLFGICLLLFVSTSAASAATLRWRYRLPATFGSLPQIVADSTGNGVAFVYSTSDPTTGQPGYTIVWLDGLGRELYKKSFGPEGAGLNVIGATRQGITYDPSFGSPLVVVDRQGHESILSRTFRGTSDFPITYTNDFGVYALESGTSNDPGNSIVFYSYNP
jgi:hypothetical protein